MTAAGSLRRKAAVALALSSWVVCLLSSVLWPVLSVALLPWRPKAAAASLGLIAVLLALPLDVRSLGSAAAWVPVGRAECTGGAGRKHRRGQSASCDTALSTPASALASRQLPTPAAVRSFLSFSLVAGHEYFPASMSYEDEAALVAGQPYVIVYEPHGVWPQGMSVFGPYATAAVPRALRGARMLVSSACFWPPVLRHMLHWLGCRPVSRADFAGQLARGRSVVVCPGGVAECLHMQAGGQREVAFLRRRTGFVRLALQHGTPLVPVFCFGQSRVYGWLRPFIDWPRAGPAALAAVAAASRRLGALPMLVWGWRGTPLPRRVPLHFAVGAPLAPPPLAVPAAPSPEEVEAHLAAFIAAMEALFEAHKARAGYPAATLTVH